MGWDKLVEPSLNNTIFNKKLTKQPYNFYGRPKTMITQNILEEEENTKTYYNTIAVWYSHRDKLTSVTYGTDTHTYTHICTYVYIKNRLYIIYRHTYMCIHILNTEKIHMG